MKDIYRILVFFTAFLLLRSTDAAVTSISYTVKSPTCANESNGYIVFDSFTTAGATGPNYNFRFNYPPPTPRINVNAGDTIFNLSAGSYFIDVIDNGIYYRENITIIDPPLLSYFPNITDPSCFGECDGSFEAFAFGGSGPYTFSFGPPANQTGIAPLSFTATGLCDGTYNLTITDANGCTIVEIDSLNENPELLPNVSSQDVLCNGDANGKAWVTPTGGTTNYTGFQWQNNASTTDTAFNYVAGTYSVTVTDSDGCTAEETFTISQPNTLSVSSTPTNATCFNTPNGSIFVTVNGGTLPYTYLWNDNNTNEDRPAIGNGVYTLTVTDNNGCTATITETITEPTDINIDSAVTSVSCNGGNDGEVLLTVSGGNGGPHQFNWSGGRVGNPITNLTAGKYFVTVTNVSGCTKIDSAVVSQPTPLSITENSTDPGCVGGADGEIDIEVSGGTPNYTYTWSDIGLATQDRTNLTAGTYTVVVEDANGCTISISNTLNNPAPILPNVTITDVFCRGGSSGTATSTPSGGSGNYVSWDWGTGSGNNNFFELNLSSGSYTVTVTDDEGCTGTETFFINQPSSSVVASISNSVNVDCFGRNSGSATAQGTGGTENNTYDFLWSDPANQTTATAVNLSANTYFVTVTDDNGCFDVATVVISEPNAISIDLDSTDVSCFGGGDGSVTAAITGGTAPYNFRWSDGTFGNGSNPSIIGKIAGKYKITVTDANLCEKVDSILINEPTELLVSSNDTDPLCFGNANGSIDLTVSGGVPGYTYNWFPGGGAIEDTNNLTAGNYTVTVTDNNGCSKVYSTTLTNPTLLTVSIDSVKNASCNGLGDGFIRAIANGGSGNYTYNWDNLAPNIDPRSNPNVPAGTYTITVTDGNGCTAVTNGNVGEPNTLQVSLSKTDASCDGVNDGTATASGINGTPPYTFNWSNGQTNPTAINLSGGRYRVTLTDNNGCTIVDSIDVIQPNAISLLTNGTNLLCNGDNSGTVSVTASGGVGNYTYQWDDANNQTTATANNLAANTYSVTVSDANGCTASASETISEPNLLAASIINPINPTCNGINDGSISVNVNGGTVAGNYQFRWSDATSQNTQIATNLGAGAYTVTVTDDNGCTTTASGSLTAPPAVVISLDSTVDVACKNELTGEIFITVNGGNAPYNFIWNDNNGNEDRTGLSVGTYTVTATDVNGCQDTRSFIINEPAQVLNIQVDSIGNLDCFGDTDGFIALTILGGVPPYNINWNDGFGLEDRFGLGVGTYDITVTDDNNCIIRQSFTISEPADLAITPDLITPANCNGTSSGSATISANGGTPPYTFNWSNGGSGTNQTNLAAGTYRITLTDVNLCIKIDSVTINQPSTIDANLDNLTNVACNGETNGSISITGIGGTAPYSFEWSNSFDNSGLSSSNGGLSAANYFVTITDANGCDTVLSYSITEPNVLSASLTISNEQCVGDNNGSIIANVSGGTAPYNYNWLPNGPNNPLNDNLTPGNYSLTVTDNNGCTVIANGVVQPASPIILTAAGADANCNGEASGTLTAVAVGGQTPYQFDWSDGGVGENRAGNVLAGNYTVTLTDRNGCTETATATVGQPDTLKPQLTTVNASCTGNADGSANSTPVGGTAPYDFVWSTSFTENNVLTSSVGNLSAGNYNVSITDANGCDTTINFTINSGNLNLVYTDSVRNDSCFNECDGFISININSGGVAPYNFAWQGGVGIGSTATGLCAGSYNVTITDQNNCDTVLTYTISEPQQLQANAISSDESCSPGNDGFVEVNPSGGTGNYTYQWSNNAGNVNRIENLIANNYSVTITDAFGCSITQNFVINKQGNLSFTDNFSNLTCFKSNDGSISISVTGTIGVPTFQWDPVSLPPQANQNGLAAGTYDVTISDPANGCSATKSYTLNQPDSIELTFVTTTASCAPGNDGSITTTVSGGTVALDYSYSWTGGFNTKDLTALSPGTYIVTITDDNGCTQIDSATVSGGNSTVVLNETITNTSCNGSCDGNITLNPTGGLAPYNFLWDDGTTQFFRTNLCSGSYDVTVTDDAGCTNAATYIVNDGPIISTSISTIPDTCLAGVGSASATSSGGLAPYTYNWSNGSNGDNVSGLIANTYSVTVTDNNGCTVTETFTITNDATFSISLTVVDEECRDDNDGKIFVNTVGGNNPLTYTWSGPQAISGANPDPVSAGTYFLTVTDRTGCSQLDTAVVGQPDVFVETFNISNESCSPGGDGTATINLLGGTAPYSYDWGSGLQASNFKGGLQAGIYRVTVSDANGCTDDFEYSITQLSNFTANSSVIDASCNGGTDGEIDLTIIGGIQPISFNWSGTLPPQEDQNNLEAGAYQVTISDATSCSQVLNIVIDEDSPIDITINSNEESCVPGGDGNAVAIVSGGVAPYSYDWSSGTPFQDSVADLSAGSYSLTVTDNNGCTETKGFSIASGSNIEANETSVMPSCFGSSDGSISLNPSGSTNPNPTYSFEWFDGTTSATINNLTAGVYRVTISDNNTPPCTKIENFTLNQPSNISTSISTTFESCSPGNDASATASTIGATPPYTYLWPGGGSTGNVKTGLSTGAYQVTVQDANGCTRSFPFTIVPPPPFSISLTSTDASCNGGNNGTISVSVIGARNPLTYDWSGGLSGGATPTMVGAGTYTVTVEDGLGCTETATTSVSEAAPILSGLNTIDENCNGGNDGSASVNPSNGNAPYDILWSNGLTTTSISNLSSGNYSVTITDATPCSIVENFTISTGQNLTVTETISNTNCNNSCDGSISLTVSGGQGPYNYDWGNGINGPNRNSLCANSYSVTITDNSGCSKIESYTISEPNPITSTIVTTNESCNPANDGTASISTTGGTAPYSYDWSDGTNGSFLQMAPAGNYTVTITDGNNCSTTENFIISPSSPLRINLAIIRDASCNGASDGAVFYGVSGNEGIVDHNWDKGQPPLNGLLNVPADTYTLTVTDRSNGCTATRSFVVGEPNPISVIATTNPESCIPGNDGSISLNPSGGTVALDYTYTWSNSLPSQATVTGLSSGSYNYTVTDDNGCAFSNTVIVNSSAPFNVDSTITNISCYNGSNGAIDLTVTGIIGTPNFNWSNSLGTNSSVSNLTKGTYTATVTDPLNGCSEVIKISIEEPDSIKANFTIVNESCSPGSDGSIVSNPSGGTPPYTYNWFDGSNNPSLSNLSFGDYDLTITDGNGCFNEFTGNIGSSAPFSILASITDASCNNGNDGSILLSVSGATGTLSYQWSNSIPNTNNPTGLSAGTYNVTITESGTSCSATESYIVNEPSSILLTTTSTPASCVPGMDGTARVSVSGGQAPYTYLWSSGSTNAVAFFLNSGSYTVTVTDASLCTSSAQVNVNSNPPFTINTDQVDDVSCPGGADGRIFITINGSGGLPTFQWSNSSNSEDQTGLASGSYTVTVTDPNSGCTGTETFTINEPNSLTANSITTNSTCNNCDGSISLFNLSGGTGTIRVNWLNAAKTPLGQSGLSATNLCAGTYFAALEDDNSCVDTISVQVIDDNAPLATVSSISESCLGAADGEVSVSSSCINNSNCNVEWRNSSGILIATTPVVQNLSSGQYFVDVIELSTSCVNSLQTFVGAGGQIIPNLIIKDNDCNALTVCSGFGKVEPTGGVSPYTYNWADDTGAPIIGTDSIGSLCSGQYSLTITDNVGCDTVLSFTINQGGNILANELITQESCPNACDGEIALFPSGGQAPYSFSWSNGAGNTNQLTNLCSGTYRVTITDQAACNTSLSINITSSSTFTYTKTKVDESCINPCDGSATINVDGGSTGYNFNWSPSPINGQGTNNVSNLCPGKYFVTITSNFGCSKIDSVEILPSSPILPNEVFVNESCSGSCDGRIELNPIGGAGSPYSYIWSPIPSNGQGNAEALGLCGQTYDVTITDASGCDTTLSITIQSASSISATIQSSDQSCGGPSAICDGSAFAQVSGGTAPYSYTWSTGSVFGPNGDTIKNVCSGTGYQLTITDANGCSIIETFNINAPTAITASLISTDATCNMCDGAITASVSGAVSPFVYQWLDQNLNPIGTNNASLTNQCAGIYFLEITDANGCSERFSRAINDQGSEAITVSSTDANCSGSCDGSASVNFTCNNPTCSVEWFDASTGSPLGITTNTIDNLCAGNYFVEVTNGSGCKAFESIIIDEPNAFNVRETITATSCNMSCNGSISLLVSGSTSPYTFNWTPSPANGQGTNSISGLCSGAYNVRIEDASGCDTTITFNVTSPSEISASFSTLEATCGQSDGIINATVSGGTITFDYSYQWFDATNTAIPGAINPTLSNVSAGAYFLEVIDDNGCQKTFTSSIGTTNGPTIVLNSITNNDCVGDNNGSIDISISGSNPPYTFNWLPFGQPTEDISNLSAGDYEVLVTNSLGCVTTDKFTITDPLELMATINTIDANCGSCNGEASISVSGGNTPYTYLWSNGSTNSNAQMLCAGTQSVEVTDANGCKKAFSYSINSIGGPQDAIISATAASCQNTCDGTASIQVIGGTAPYSYLWLHNGSTNNNLSNLCAGKYTIQITDANSCVLSKQVEITSPTDITINEIVSNNECNALPCRGAIQANVSGGLAPYTYSWSSNASNNSNFESGLCAGTYFVTVTDINGCSKVKAIVVSDNIFPVNAQPTSINASCFGSCDGSLISNLSLSSDYDYLWLDQNGNSVANVNADANGVVCPGNYVLEITAKPSGCKSYFSAKVDEAEKINIGATLVNNISCSGSCDGEIFVSTTGGSLPFSYLWDDPEQQKQVPASGLCADQYTVTATDANGCSAITSITLTNPPTLTINVLASSFLNCSADCDASANVSAQGGVPPYTYNWSGGQMGNNPNNLCFGPNVVSVTDAAGCIVQETVSIAAIDTVEAIVPTKTIFCDGDSIRLLGKTLGTNISSVAWYEGNNSTFFTSNIDTTIFRGIGTHNFYLIASDGNCSDETNYIVEVVANPSLNLNPTAQLIRDEVLNISLGGKDASYLYNWQPTTNLSDSSIAEPIASPKETVTYTLTVTDTNGCVFIDSIRVSYIPEIEVPSGFTPNGDGVNDVWNIELLEDFPNAKVQIFNRWGELLYEQRNGYLKPWNGTYEGKALPVGTYYYIIDLNVDKIDPVTGPITIVK